MQFTKKIFSFNNFEIVKGNRMTGLKRVLGLPMLTFYGTGMILGAGIYSIIGKTAGIAGESVWLSLVIAAAVATLAALSYAELAAMFPLAGGEYVYLRKAFPTRQWIGISVGLMMAFAGIATSSTVSLAFAGYFEEYFALSPLIIAFFLLLAFTAINILGIKESSWANATFTIIEASGLILFIYLGTQNPNFGVSLLSPPSWATVSGSALIIFAYFGFENMVNFAEETINPEKTLPTAILMSIAVSTVLYVLVAIAAVGLLSIEELSKSAAPLADAVRQSSPQMARILTAIALFATANTVLISLVTTSRILYGMARDQALHGILANLQKSRGTPWVSAVTSFLIATALLALQRIELLASISAFITMLAFIFVHTALIILRLHNPLRHRPFRVPITIGPVPFLPVLGIIVTTALMLQFELTVYLINGGFFVVLFAVQFTVSYLKRKKQS